MKRKINEGVFVLWPDYSPGHPVPLGHPSGIHMTYTLGLFWRGTYWTWIITS